MNTIRRYGIRRVTIELVVISLLAVVGCTGQGAGQGLVGLLGDAAAQFLTYWIL